MRFLLDTFALLLATVAALSLLLIGDAVFRLASMGFVAAIDRDSSLILVLIAAGLTALLSGGGAAWIWGRSDER